MNFAYMQQEGFIRIVTPNMARAKSLEIASEETLETVLLIPLTKTSSKTIVRDLYEALRQMIESKGYAKGFKFENHESLKYFLQEKLQLKELALYFDTLRKIRNGINYYGDKVNLETARDALTLVPKYISQLKDIS
ncbi:MAG: hypothetical protein ACMXYF_02470 [Candidatus Woesearchaeota archaeon]